VITCNSCGELVQADLANCQRCGMPLSSADQEVGDSQKGAHEYPDLPAWLESLRVNERLSSPANEQPFFSTEELIDEGEVPSWMRPENAELMEKGNSAKYAAWRPASTPAPNTDDELGPPKGFSASSLIDEQSLPTWIYGNQQNSQATTGAAFGAPDAQRNFSAASLIQPEALPDWMKSLPPSSQPAAPYNSVWGGERPPDSSQVGINSFTSNPPPQSFSAHELIDPQAVPHWMSGQQAGFSPDAPGGLTGASLIDMNALPAWLRSSEAQQQTGMPAMGEARPVSNGMNPRVDMRVPSRPRGEMIAHEQSEVAANVFSSMLGVASSAPYFPSAGMQSNAPSQTAGFAGAPPAQGYNPAGYQGGQPAMARQPEAYGPGIPPERSRAGQRSKTNTSGSKPAKRGIIETIRSWFS
jgi:hypothetical protein